MSHLLPYSGPQESRRNTVMICKDGKGDLVSRIGPAIPRLAHKPLQPVLEQRVPIQRFHDGKEREMQHMEPSRRRIYGID